MLYRAIGVFFQHSKSADIKHFLSMKFWEDEEKATKTMEEVLARTNHYVSTAFLHMSVSHIARMQTPTVSVLAHNSTCLTDAHMNRGKEEHLWSCKATAAHHDPNAGGYAGTS